MLRKHKTGFTIIELVVSISVIAILSTIIGVSYAGWRKHVAETEVKNDLALASVAMEQSINFNDTYPNTIPSSFVSKSSAILSLIRGGDGLSYCISASSLHNPSVIYHIKNGEKEVEVGACD